MSILSRKIGSVLFGLVLLTGSAWAAGPTTIQGDVKGPDGRAVKGAEVTIERKGGKPWSDTMKTDRDGRYVFKYLEVGAYNLRVSANGLASTAAQDVRAKMDRAITVTFNLKKQTGTAAAGPAVTKKAKHMVWMPAETGSNLGGRWVEVNDTTAAAGPSMNNLTRASGDAIKGMQGGPGGNGGSNSGQGGGR
jgi:hypothetical protein